MMDDSRLMLPSVKYNGTGNFRAWSNLAMLSLENSDCLEVIEADVPEPADNGAKGAWRKTRAKACLLISKMIDGDVQRFVENEDLIMKKDPFQMWKKIGERFNTVNYSTKIDILAQFHNIALGPGGVEVLIEAISKARGDCSALSIDLEDFELKVKLLTNLPPDLVDLSYQQRDKSHENDTFAQLAETIRSYERGHRVESSSTALWAGIPPCSTCDRRHRPTSQCWGKLSDEAYTKKLAELKAARGKQGKKQRKQVGANVAAVDTLVDNNSFDYYSLSGRTTTVPVSSAMTWIADSGAETHMTHHNLTDQ